MADRFAARAKGMSSPADRHYEITPDDGNDLPRIPRCLYCAQAGDVVIRDKHGTDLAYTLTAGQLLPFRGVRILASGTDAVVYGWE